MPFYFVYPAYVICFGESTILLLILYAFGAVLVRPEKLLAIRVVFRPVGGIATLAAKDLLLL